MIPQKEVRFYANQNDIDEMDLDYAVKTLICKKENRMIEAVTYESLVKEKSQHIWNVAKEVLKI